MANFRKMIYLTVALVSPLVILFGAIRLPAPVRSTALTNPPTIFARAALESIELSSGYDQIAQLGDTISFTHVLTNSGSTTEQYLIEVSTPVTWPLQLFSSGNLTGSQQLSLTLDATATSTFYVSLSVPANQSIISGTLIPIILTATSQLSPTLPAAITDTVTVYTTNLNIIYSLYLPTLARNGGVNIVALGVDFGHRPLISDTTALTAALPLARQMGAQWTRAWLNWTSVETSPGHYDWTWNDLQLNRFAEEGFNTIAVIYHPPAWTTSGTGCGPISDTVALEQFVTAAVTRYKGIVKGWEFINEPDGSAPYVYGPVVGCWGPQPQIYTDRLATFYTTVKAIDPSALVVFGGLAYDNWTAFDRNFFTHTLESGAGAYFDVLSLHFYPINPQDFPTIGYKINEIRDIMQRHGVYNKLIWITETSMWTNFDGLAAQQNYIVQELTRGFCARADKLFWFAALEGNVPPALKRWLINKQFQPDQGYYTFQHYASQIQGAFCRGPYTQVPTNIEAYNFSTPTGELYTLWATNGSALVKLPAGSSATLIDRDGQTSQPLTAANGLVSTTVGTLPVFVVIAR